MGLKGASRRRGEAVGGEQQSRLISMANSWSRFGWRAVPVGYLGRA